MGHPNNAYLILIFYYLLKINYLDNDDVYCFEIGNISVRPDWQELFSFQIERNNL